MLLTQWYLNVNIKYSIVVKLHNLQANNWQWKHTVDFIMTLTRKLFNVGQSHHGRHPTQLGTFDLCRPPRSLHTFPVFKLNYHYNIFKKQIQCPQSVIELHKRDQIAAFLEKQASTAIQ